MEYADLRLLAGNSAAGTVRRVSLNGRDYLVAPITGIVPGVLRGSQGALYYPPDEVGRNVAQWDGVPIVAPDHPTHNGVPVSARHPAVAERFGIGTLYKTVFNGRLRHEGWFDVDRTRAADRRFGTDVYDRLTSGRPIEVSTGLYTDNEAAAPGASHDGKPYDYIARNYRPDHLAVLPNKTGACNIQDGCGVLVNREVRTPPAPRPNNNTAGEPGFDSDEQRKAFFGLKKQGDEKAAAAGKGEEKSYTPPQVTTRSSEIEVHRGYQDVRKNGTAQHAKDYIDQVDRMKGQSYVRALAMDHGVPIDKNPGGKGTDLATSLVIRDRMVAKHFPTANAHPNQPRHAGSGKYLPHNAGTGKGLPHEQALEGFRSVRDYRLEHANDGGDEVGEEMAGLAGEPHRLQGATKNTTWSTGMVKVNEWSAALAPALWMLTNAELGLNKEFSSDDERRAAFAAMADSGNKLSAAATKRSELAGKANKSRQHGEHLKAAAAHEKAAAAHEASGNTKVSSLHRRAASEHYGKAKTAAATTNEDHPMIDRERAVALLTANCSCDEDRVAVTNLSDETLQALAANARFTKQDDDEDEEPDDDDEDDGRPGRNGRRCADGMQQNDDATPSYGERSQPDAPGDSDPHLEDDPEEAAGTAGTVADGRAGKRPAPGGSGATPRRMALPAPGRNSHQGEVHVTTSNAAPARSRLTREEQEDLAFARNAKLQAKRGLINRLTANVAHDEARLKHHQTRLMALSLNELRQMAELLPPPDQYQPAAPVANEEGAAYYGGMGMDLAPGTGLTANEAAEVLDIGSARAGYDPWLAQAGK